ncbi:MAG: hypothetical protein BWY04_01294 [candidate division CPR1 bacterium ADurb.Bin160]|uniref:Uncharacterized protein n=1 Tax=candidate division CPR1 bacterium ADurb.Bin160 TaxID=1852826 RepID=A0A1V5ZK71_9BACT|nr:MAG: hypothetical protein BWY04_01294 [candidate division CPR1 bacterium ADurb.Bin160]
MSSPGIDRWIAKAPESWAKLAKKSSKKQTFEQFKIKFFEGAEKENKSYLKNYLTDDQLEHIYTQGHGGEKIEHPLPTPVVPPKRKIIVQRKGKTYSKTVSPRWGISSKFVLKLAAKSKIKSKEYYKYLDILIAQGRTRQAAVKKIQRTRKELSK